MSIRFKIILPMIISTLTAIIAVLLVVIMVFSSYVEDSTATDIHTYSNVMEQQLDGLQAQARLCMLSITSDSDFAEIVDSGDMASIINAAKQSVAQNGIDFLTLTDAQGMVLYRTHLPNEAGDDLSKNAATAAALQGDTIDLITTGNEIPLSIRAAAPLTIGERLIGTVTVGYRLDTADFVDSIQEMLGVEATIFLGSERLSTTVLNENGTRAVGSQASDAVISQVLERGIPYTGKTEILKRQAYVEYRPITNITGETIGMFFVGQYTDTANAVVGDFILRGMIAGFVLLAVALPVGLVIARRITTPIQSLVRAADQLSVGDIDVQLEVRTKDELKQLEGAFNRMIDANRQQAEVLSIVAQGDLRVDIPLRSEQDVVGCALDTMLTTNNNVYQQIIGVANQVATGSAQVAEGAQQLAENNTEQAATVEQLTLVMAEIAEKTRANADRAAQAARLEEDVRSMAEKGSQQMENMMEAVQQINQASNSIQNVIDAIEDIASQTKILAINASIEAAHAGKLGTGFAVVADEVRALASKSSEAAQDSSRLIADSIEKAKLGSSIAGETMQMLAQIVDGIAQSSDMVEQISQDSQQQSDAIESINQSVQQVSTVVQSTSTLSQETAASSQEMSSQSRILTDLVGQFQLKEGTDGNTLRLHG